MWTTKSEPKSFIYRNCKSSVNQNLQSWILRIFSENIPIWFFYGKNSYRPEIYNQIKADSKTVGIKV